MNKKKLAVAAYLLGIHAALLVVLVHFDVPAKLAARLGLGPYPDWGGVAFMREVHQDMDASVPDGSVIFIGDSITQSLATAAVAPKSVNFGISGQRSDQLIASMDIYGSMRRADAVVVMIGTNDVLQGVDRGLGDRLGAILRKIAPGVRVVMSGIPPMADARLDVAAQATAEAARRACGADQRCTFVDARVALSGHGSLQSDGVHLTPLGYTRWIGALRRALGITPSPA